MVNVIKGIDIVSHGDGKHYTNRLQMERALEKQGMNIMEEKTFREKREKFMDEKHSQPKSPSSGSAHNHVHIDLNNMKTHTSYRDQNGK